MLYTKNKVCCGPEIEEPGVSRHIDLIGSMDKYSLGGEEIQVLFPQYHVQEIIVNNKLYIYITEEIE